MNSGIQTACDSIFLVKCADFKCLAVRSADGRWKSFYDDITLTGAVEPVMSIPIELVLPFLSANKRERLLSTAVRLQN